MFSIGEFSKITGLTVKTLRFYHEQGLLKPASIDDLNGYRYYGPAQVERARAIACLRSLEFPLSEIAELLGREDEAELIEIFQQQRAAMEERMRLCRQAVRSLDQFIGELQEHLAMIRESEFEVEEKHVPSQLIAAVRMKGKYSDCGPAFAKIGRNFGRQICGKCFLLHYDDEYRESDADFETCMPIRKGNAIEGIAVRQLPGGDCVSLMHRGPYEQLGRSYARLFEHVSQKGYCVECPTREIYLKGPGMIFKGNPKNYLTEIQVFYAAP
jgi:DNA-binding transcriptional MerR regulator